MENQLVIINNPTVNYLFAIITKAKIVKLEINLNLANLFINYLSLINTTIKYLFKPFG